MIPLDKFFMMWEQYNNAVWPMQIITYVLGILAFLLAVKKLRFSDRAIAGVLSFLWLWSGLVTFIVFFGDVSAQYYIWGSVWILQSVVLFYVGFVKSRLEFEFKNRWYNYIGLVFIAYALIIYPLVGSISGHPYPGGPIFGVAPCPVCIFTFGLFLLTAGKLPFFVMVIPFLWSLTGIYAVLMMGVYADGGEVIAGVSSVVIMLLNNRKAKADNHAELSSSSLG